MAPITLKELNIKSKIPIMDLLDLQLTIKRNSHGHLRIHAVVAQEIGDSMMAMPMEQEKITVLADNAPILSGRIKNVYISNEGRGYEITLTANTNSSHLNTYIYPYAETRYI